jgi:hypothetical protein
MIKSNLTVSTLIAALLLGAGTDLCRADLFALTSGLPQVVRIDSATLQVKQTYADPFGPIGPPVSSLFTGLAFDGRRLTWTQDLGGITGLAQFDVLTEEWIPPMPIFDIFFPENIAGLGYLGPDSGGAFLGVSRSRINEPLMPAQIYRIEPFGVALPLGELPPEYRAQALDVDPTTGDIWIAAQNIALQRIELLKIGIVEPLPELLAADDEELASPLAVTPGVVIQHVLAPPLPPTSIRGLGFDNGQLFVVSVNRTLYEIDRATGDVLRSAAFTLPASIGGLAGGTVVPEPRGLALTVVALVSALALVYRRPAHA